MDIFLGRKAPKVSSSYRYPYSDYRTPTATEQNKFLNFKYMRTYRELFQYYHFEIYNERGYYSQRKDKKYYDGYGYNFYYGGYGYYEYSIHPFLW